MVTNLDNVKPHILFVDDDQALRELMNELLQLEGFQVSVASNGQEALQVIREAIQPFDLVILDVMMPQLNGIETLKQLRSFNSLPVLMLSAKAEEIDRVMGLELGADDYLPKPFGERELLARIRAILRRQSAFQPGHIDRLEHDDVVVAVHEQQVWVQDKRIELTSTELALLAELMRNAGKMVSKEHLSENVLHKPLAPFDRTIDMHISNLRKKLPPRPDELERLKTVRGRGYLWGHYEANH